MINVQFFRRLTTIILMSIVVSYTPVNAEQTVTPKTGTELINLLSEGGYVVYFRHAQTTKTPPTIKTDVIINDCSTQRNLSSEGIELSKSIGRVFQQLDIPVTEVLTSPYCRCKDTASNMFPDKEFKKTHVLSYAIHMRKDERDHLTEGLKTLLKLPLKIGQNRILVSHTANLKEAADIWPEVEGEAHVFKPFEQSYEYIGKIIPADWIAYVKQPE